jgi:Tfp pilus assembly protein FimT
LVELVMVMLITAVMAVVAVPKMVDTTMWSLRTYSDTLVSQLQAARRMALAQRRPIVATVATTGVTLAYAAGGTIATLTCPSAAANCIAETGSVTFNSGNSGSAVTSSGSTLSITVSGSGSFSRQLQIAPETGLIQAPS